MIPEEVRKFFSEAGKKGGKTTSEKYDMKARGKRGGLQAAKNRKNA